MWQAIAYVPVYKQAGKPLRLWTFPIIKFIFSYSFAKYELCQTFFEVKVVTQSISYQKVSGCICQHPPPSRGETDGSHIWVIRSIADWSYISNGMFCRLVTDESHIGHIWVKDGSQFGHRIGYTWIPYGLWVMFQISCRMIKVFILLFVFKVNTIRT